MIESPQHGHGMSSVRPVAVFLHVATMGRYVEVLHDVLAAVYDAGLASRARHVQVTVVGEGAIELEQRYAGAVVQLSAAAVTAYEHPSIEAIRTYSREVPDAAILYLNCLGGRHRGASWTLRAEWRKLLYYLLVQNAARCLTALDQHDVCGVDWSSMPMPHMTSNNWWANASYINTLPSTAETIATVLDTDLSKFGPSWVDIEAKKRHAGEFWIGMNPEVRPKVMLELGQLGFPPCEFGSVAWWGLPGVRWETIARRVYGEPMGARDYITYRSHVATANIRFFARRGRDYLRRQSLRSVGSA
jgi:hypothetical protein